MLAIKLDHLKSFDIHQIDFKPRQISYSQAVHHDWLNVWKSGALMLSKNKHGLAQGLQLNDG